MITAIMPIENGYPTHMAVNSKTNLIYLTYPDEDRILLVDPVSRSTIGKIQAGCPETMAVNTATNKVYVLCSDGIYSIDSQTKTLQALMNRKVHFGGGLDINPITNRIYTTPRNLFVRKLER